MYSCKKYKNFFGIIGDLGRGNLLISIFFCKNGLQFGYYDLGIKGKYYLVYNLVSKV